jgi:3-oxocholest-4-en-26-oyl-CoA dehydrogenase alpha subunit
MIRSAFEQLVFEEEMAYAEAPIGWHLASVNMMGPTIIEFGSPQQTNHMIPEIRAGNVCFRLGYSEPENGSDLAGMKTAAFKEGNEWVPGLPISLARRGRASPCAASLRLNSWRASR